MGRYFCDSCGKVGWSDGQACPWCGGSRLRVESPAKPGGAERLELQVPRRRIRLPARIIGDGASSSTTDHDTRRKRVAAAIFMVLIVVAALLGAVRTGLIKVGEQTGAPPKVQVFTSAGEMWVLYSAQPRVLNFSTFGPSQIWVNLTTSAAGSRFYICPAGTPIQSLNGSRYGGSIGANFQLHWTFDAGSWEIVFTYYHVSGEAYTDIVITWTSPLKVVTS